MSEAYLEITYDPPPHKEPNSGWYSAGSSLAGAAGAFCIAAAAAAAAAGFRRTVGRLC